MELIQPKLVDRAGFAVGQDHSFADQFGLGLFKFGKDRASAQFGDWHGYS
jgi:hypothetical protein